MKMKKLFAVAAAFVLLWQTGICLALDVISHIPENPQKALILIHGYGQDGKRMQSIAGSLEEKMPDTALYFPTAPDSAPFGGYQWFTLPVMGADMITMDKYKIMLASAVENIEVLHDLIEDIHEDLGLPYDYIDVAGFSQGGLMAVLTAVTNPHTPGRAVSLSGVPLIFTEDFTAKDITAKPDILLIQGNADDIVPPESIDMTNKTLQSVNITPQTVTVPGLRHRVTPQVLEYLADFLE